LGSGWGLYTNVHTLSHWLKVNDFQVTNGKLGENTDPGLPIMAVLNLHLESARLNRKALPTVWCADYWGRRHLAGGEGVRAHRVNIDSKQLEIHKNTTTKRWNALIF
jgi:hypothetical protein